MIAHATHLFAISTAQAQTTEEIVEKHLAAVGGREALSRLQSRVTTAAMTLTTPGGDVSGTIEIWAKLPNKSRSIIKLDLSAFGMGEMLRDQRFDGTSGYAMDSVNGDQEITGAQLAGMKSAAFPTPLLRAKESGLKVETSGTAKVGDRDTHVLVMTPTEGTPIKMYIDTETYHALKVVQTLNVPQTGAEIEQSTEFSDFRDVDGVKLPFLLKTSSAVQSFTLKVTKVEHNRDLDDKMFARPAGK
jgi:outer membrane lipoprotein-sorting protein